MKTNVPVRGIWIQFYWTNPQKFKFAEDCPRVKGGGGGGGLGFGFLQYICRVSLC